MYSPNPTLTLYSPIPSTDTVQPQTQHWHRTAPNPALTLYSLKPNTSKPSTAPLQAQTQDCHCIAPKAALTLYNCKPSNVTARLKFASEHLDHSESDWEKGTGLLYRINGRMDGAMYRKILSDNLLQ
ncbi:hypothetical protein NFI96_026494, partial [Prochilodus magdalenae]